MSGWKDKSNEEINSAVAAHGGLDGCELECFKPCENPSHAWPAIMHLGICLNKKIRDMESVELGSRPLSGPYEWEASLFDEAKCYRHANPLRAAMILFLDVEGVKS